MAEMLGISKSQVQRDYDSIWCLSPREAAEREAGDKLLRLRVLGRQVGDRWTYPRLAEITGVCEDRIGDLVRAAERRALCHALWELETAKRQDV